jgi:hypothetical protein
MGTQIIAPTTAAVTSDAFYIEPGKPQKISADGLAGAETVTVYAEKGAGNFFPMTDASAILTATNPVSSIVAGGSYKFAKTLTAGAAGAYVG